MFICRSHRIDCINLSMGLTATTMIPLPYYPSGSYYYSPDVGVGVSVDH